MKLDEVKREVISVRLDPPVREKLQAFIAKHECGVSIGRIVNIALAKFLIEREEFKP